ncbi:MAG: hypothetical protein KF889_13190 [Alphaproteobacteria bacterium]|nr:hypothetical protein [Alphaproteobacteria bacterium]MCW5739049.1 hypothetical protein [Alphaproteobacteria bacterium]
MMRPSLLLSAALAVLANCGTQAWAQPTLEEVWKRISIDMSYGMSFTGIRSEWARLCGRPDHFIKVREAAAAAMDLCSKADPLYAKLRHQPARFFDQGVEEVRLEATAVGRDDCCSGRSYACSFGMKTIGETVYFDLELSTTSIPALSTRIARSYCPEHKDLK